MKKHSTALLSALLVSSLMMFSPLTQADNLNKQEQELKQREQELNQREQELSRREQSQDARERSYGEKVGLKALSGINNINSAFLEFPKNIINVTNRSDSVVLGVIGGAISGMLNTAGRVITGATDLITAPLPTLRIAQPDYIWQDFDVDTTYGDVFRLDNQPDAPMN